MMGENPFLSDPNINKVRKALSALDFLVVQDIFLTETAEFADVILPATTFMEKDGTYTNTDRRVQIGRKVLDPPRPGPPGLADHPGHLQPRRAADGLLAPDRRSSTSSCRSCPTTRGLSYDNLGLDGQALSEPRPAAQRRHRRALRRALRHRRRARAPRARGVAAGQGAAVGGVPVHPQHGPPARALAHRLDDAPLVRAGLDPARAARLPEPRRRRRRWASPTATSCASARAAGRSRLRARLSHRDTPGTCFMPFHFREAAANLLTIDEIDPIGKIPEFKFCAVQHRARRAARRCTSRLAAREGAMATPGMRVQPRYPGTEARAGKFPGPSLIPALERDPAPLRVAAARGARRALARRAPAAVRDRGRDLVLPALPHLAAEGRAARGLPRPHVLAARLRRADRRDEGDATATTSRSRSSRSRASGAATSRRPRPSTSARSPLAEVDAAVAAARAGEHGEARGAASASDERRPERPLRARRRALPRCLRRALAGELRPEEIVATLKDSGLRGMGGAGFPTGAEVGDRRRRRSPSRKYTICNADESEPGTFKDRQILAEQPHLVLEGMLLGMLVTGSEEGWVFIRHEYGPEEEVLRAEIERAARGGPARRRRRWAPAGGCRSRSSPRPAATSSARSRRCWSAWRATAASRATSRRSPGLYGLWGKPTLMNSVETFADVPDHPRARRRLVEGAGRQRRDRPEVLRDLGPRRAARRLLRARPARRRAT